MIRCPYFRRQRKPKFLYCDMFRVTFHNPAVRRRFLYGRCFHPENYMNCPLKKELDDIYSSGAGVYGKEKNEEQ